MYLRFSNVDVIKRTMTGQLHLNAVSTTMPQIHLFKDYFVKTSHNYSTRRKGLDIFVPKVSTQKGASSWLTVLPIRDVNFDLNKSEFRDAVELRYDWEVPDLPPVCVCGGHFNLNHAMICKRGCFAIQRLNELRDLEAEIKCFAWCAMALKLNQFYKRSQEKS